MGAPMDLHTLEILEFNKVRELVAGYAACSLGKELARQLEPFTDLAKARAEIGLVSEMVVAIGLGQAPPFGGLHDVRLTVRRAAIGAMLTAEELLAIAETMACTGAMYRFRMRLDERCQRLIDMLGAVEDLGAAAKTITGCIDQRSHVLDSASPELSNVRRQLAAIEEKVQEHLRRLLRDPKVREILRYPNATVSGDHFVLPVAVNHRHKLPGVVHRTSSTGETVFIEPASVSGLSAERAILKSDEDREVKRVLRRLTSEVARIARPLSIGLDVLAKLDLITAKARFSRDFGMAAPDLNDDGKLWLRQARHPLLENLFRHETLAEGAKRRQVVPIDVRLGIGFNLLVVTGPNTGGKTVTLKTTGLLCVMAQSGMHIPAGDGSIVPFLNNVLADIGDEQSLEQSLSTFSSHVSRIASILKQTDDRCLVLLDELGAGTDPTEGAALGRAILDELDRLKCRAIVTTHLGDLKTYAFTNDHAENAAVEFDVESLRPTYRLHIGQFGMSCALQIAKRLKLPRDLVRRAHRYLRRRQKRVPEMARLQAMKAETERAREEALKAQLEATRKREELEREKAEIARVAEAERQLKEFRSQLQPNDRVHVSRFDQQGRVVRVDHKRNIVAVSVGIGQWEVSFDEVFPTSETGRGS
jgi:DNA mismatch repair protein MutS2